MRETSPKTTTKKPPWYQKFVPYLSLAVFIGIILFFLVYLKSDPVCTTPSCLAVGRLLASSLNTSVDPCEDFAAYACSGWAAAHPIPVGKSKYTTFEPLFEKLDNFLRNIFEHQESFKEKNGGIYQQSKSVLLQLDLYRECTNWTARDRRGLEPLKKLLIKVLGAEWPALNESSLEGVRQVELKNGNFLQTLAQISALDINKLVDPFVEKDFNNTKVKNINFDSPTQTLTQMEFTNVDGLFDNEVKAHENNVYDFVQFFLSGSANFSSSLNFTTKNVVISRFKEVLALEKSLAMAKLPESQDQDPAVWYNKMSLEEFTNMTGNVLNYTDYLNELAVLYKLPYRFNDTDLVIVRDIGYYKQLSKILTETPPLTLHNYLGYQLARFWSLFTDNSFWDYYLEQTVPEEPFWKNCLERVDRWVASHLYVRQKVLPVTKEKAEEIVEELQEVFVEEVLKKDVNWLDEQTRRKALEKAAQTYFHVAYPDWLLNGNELDRIAFHYPPVELPRVVEGHYFESSLEVTRMGNAAAAAFRKLHQPINVAQDFPAEPFDVNGYAYHKKNVVVILAGLLQPPKFDPTVPAYVTLGGLGSFTGHEITHHFDEVGALYDLNGNLANWFSPTTKERFESKLQCFVEQYEAIVDQQTGVRLNGSLTLGENIADNGGLRMAFRALEKRLKRDIDRKERLKLPQMEKFTPQQIFFISYAHLWFEHYLTEAKKDAIYHKVHLPGEYRINVPLSNFEPFSAAFQCPLGSKMNPKKKCRLW